MFKNRESIDEFISINGIDKFLDLMILDGQIKTYEYKGLKEIKMPTKHIMTRTEAIALLADRLVNNEESAAKIIDFYIAAGMLEIKEELSPATKRCKAMKAAFGLFLSEADLRRMEKCFDDYGLKIIDK